MPDKVSFEPQPSSSGGGVSDVTASPPIASTGGATPDISLSGIVGLAHGGLGADSSSVNQNRVLASPNGSAGAPTFRALVAADLPPVPLPDLFFDPLAMGTALGWTYLPSSNYVWGGKYQALSPVSVAAVRAVTNQTSGNFVLSVWVNGSRARTGSVSLSAAGTYTVTFGSALAVPTGGVFTVSAIVVGGAASDLPSSDYDFYYAFPAGPKLRLLFSNIYSNGDVEPTNQSSSRVFGVVPVLG